MSRLLALLPLFALACEPADKDGESGDTCCADQTITSTGGLYTLDVQWTPEPPVSGDVVLGIVLGDAATGEPVTGATLDLTPWMVDMGHGVQGDVVETEIGEGSYEVAFAFSMPGPWQITVDIIGPAGQDQAVWDVDVE